MLSSSRFHLRISNAIGRDEFWPNLELTRWIDGDRKRSNPRYFARLLNGTPGDPAWLHDGSFERTQGRLEVEAPVSRYVRVREVYDEAPGGAILDAVSSSPLGQDSLSDLEPNDFIGEGRGLSTLDNVDEISMVGMPDLHAKPPAPSPRERPILFPEGFAPCREFTRPSNPPMMREREVKPFSPDEILNLQRALVNRCQQLRNRIAVLEYPDQSTDITRVTAYRRQFDSPFAALYHPWVRTPDAFGPAGSLRLTPPSGHICGLYARMARNPGVHHSPANLELEGVRDLPIVLDAEEHGFLNDHQVNAIRPYEGRGIRVYGARTLSSAPEWTYVNVRRLMSLIEQSIERQVNWTVFEPADRRLRSNIVRVVTGFLAELWQAGVLDGATREDAFSVTCDETTTTPDDEQLGRLICTIAINAPSPAEFVTVKLGINEGQITFKEITKNHAGNF